MQKYKWFTLENVTLIINQLFRVLIYCVSNVGPLKMEMEVISISEHLNGNNNKQSRP